MSTGTFRLGSLAFSLAVASSVALGAACGDPSVGTNEFGNGKGSSGSNGSSGDDGSSGSTNFGSSGSDPSTSGGNPATCAATSATPQKAKVDMIFVIDDSGSMTEEMTQIRTNVNNFAQKIGTVGLDFTVTFITKRGTNAGQNQICVPAPLAAANCADNPPSFHHINQDVQSTDSFQLILQTYPQWSSFLRQDATKVFIEVSDDRSDMAYTQFDTSLLALQPAGMFGTATQRNYIFDSIVSKPAGDAIPSNNVCPTAAGKSVDYQNLTKLTGGICDEVCKTDYSGVLDNIAKGIIDKLGCTLSYPTAEAADPTKVVVTFTPKGGAAQTLTQVTDESKCAANADGWYYDNPNAPTKILLCPTECTNVNASAGGKIDALVGCKGAAPK